MRESALGNSAIGKRVVDYKEYQQQLDSYQNSNSRKGGLAGLMDWSKPSQIVSLNDPPPAPSTPPHHNRS